MTVTAIITVITDNKCLVDDTRFVTRTQQRLGVLFRRIPTIILKCLLFDSKFESTDFRKVMYVTKRRIARGWHL